MEDQVDEEVKNERVHRLIALSFESIGEGICIPIRKSEVVEVIPEAGFIGDKEKGLLEGFTDNYLKVVFPGTEDMIGEIIQVKIEKAGYPHCEGKFVRNLEESLRLKGRLFNFIQQKSPTSISGEMNASFYQFSGGSNPD